MIDFDFLLLKLLRLMLTISPGLDLSKVSNDMLRDDVTSRVRKHVGSGILFSYEEDGIWLYNRSEVSHVPRKHKS